MNRSRLIATAAGAVTLLLSAGTALALASGGVDVTGGTTPQATSTSTELTTESTTEFTTESTAESTSESTVPAAPAGVAISAEQAAQLALAHVGGGTVTQIERELEHGRMEWKVRVMAGGKRFDVRVDAATGAITRVDADDRGDDRRGGDDGDHHGGNSGPGGGGDDDDHYDDHGGNSGGGGSGSSGSGGGGHSGRG